MDIYGLFNYFAVIVLMMIGFYIVITHSNLIKKIDRFELISVIYIYFIYING